MSTRPRVIIASPDPLECEYVADSLSSEGIESVRRGSPAAAVAEMLARPFDLLVADAGYAFQHGLHVASRARRPMTPTVVIGEGAAQSDSVNLQVIYLPRPIERTLLVCTVSMAIVDGRPARRSVRKAVHRFEALVNGTPSYIIDVSKEGLRLEVPRDRRSVPPPYFNVRVPMIGVAVTVQRMWALRSAEGAAVTWCGGALSQNQARAASAWLAFVDTISTAGTTSSRSVQIQ